MRRQTRLERLAENRRFAAHEVPLVVRRYNKLRRTFQRLGVLLPEWGAGCAEGYNFVFVADPRARRIYPIIRRKHAPWQLPARAGTWPFSAWPPPPIQQQILPRAERRLPADPAPTVPASAPDPELAAV